MTDDPGQVDDTGFEYKGRFYPWKVTDIGKDLMLIDRFTGMAIADFFDTIDDENERGRGPILLALIATSLRAGNPSWSVQRIVGAVEALSLSDVEFVNPESEAPEAVPPQKPRLDVVPSRSTATGSSPSSTPQDSSSSETSYATPV